MQNLCGFTVHQNAKFLGFFYKENGLLTRFLYQKKKRAVVSGKKNGLCGWGRTTRFFTEKKRAVNPFLNTPQALLIPIICINTSHRKKEETTSIAGGNHSRASAACSFALPNPRGHYPQADQSQ